MNICHTVITEWLSALDRLSPIWVGLKIERQQGFGVYQYHANTWPTYGLTSPELLWERKMFCWCLQFHHEKTLSTVQIRGCMVRRNPLLSPELPFTPTPKLWLDASLKCLGTLVCIPHVEAFLERFRHGHLKCKRTPITDENPFFRSAILQFEYLDANSKRLFLCSCVIKYLLCAFQPLSPRRKHRIFTV